jgi:ribokinase
MVGQVGSDGGAEFMLSNLDHNGVLQQGTVLQMQDSPTGTAMVMLLPGGENSIIIVGGANTAAWALSQQQTEAIQGATAVLLQREIPDEINLQVARLCQESKVHVVMDAGGADAPLQPELLSCVNLLSPNETELSRMTGMPTNTREQVIAAAKELQSSGSCDVLVKLGSKGALLVPRAQPMPHTLHLEHHHA